MKWFYDLRLSTKLILCFVIVAIISGVVGVIGIQTSRRLTIMIPFCMKT